jgi:Concanavalin A-like lectin/glucanases superfamily
MSWTTVCDLRMEQYQNNQTLDTTGFRNHADVLGSAATHPGFVSFQGDDAQLEVPVRDDSLARFAGLRVQALVWPGAITRRYNIAEGWMSFAFFVESDGRLMGTIYDGQQWTGLDSGATKVAPNDWARVMFEYDGVSIAKLTLNGPTVGSRTDMPAGLRQPHQVITLGHWPRGDGRYTLQGHLGHVRIERRDYEDYWRDAMQIAFCRRRLTPTQADAKREMEYLASTLGPDQRARLQRCAIEQAERMRKFMHELRGLQPRGPAQLRLLGERLRAVWCCSFNAPAAREELLKYLRWVAGAPGSEGRKRFLALVEEFFDISAACAYEGIPVDRMRELCRILFPELRSFEMDLRQALEAV